MTDEPSLDPGIEITKIWQDDCLVECRVSISDGNSSYSTAVYVAHDGISQLVLELENFRQEVYGGIYDIYFGEFGPEYANGAFHARLNFCTHSKLHITVHAQSDFFDFGKKSVASEATLYLISEPILLDNFINELKQLAAGISSAAKLKAIKH
ncbi:MAG: hypothetical protein K8T91_20545 [Planctomycetes bacterium]|nr:hypothetical protein [Planctomycetota bacterium]